MEVRVACARSAEQAVQVEVVQALQCRYLVSAAGAGLGFGGGASESSGVLPRGLLCVARTSCASEPRLYPPHIGEC